MSYTPILTSTGYTGWRFLTLSLEKQQALYDKSAETVRDTAYFKANIGSIKSAEDLVSNRRLLSIALTAFGLEADLSSKAFIKKVLEANPADSNAFINRLSDKRYAALNDAFGFGDTAKTGTEGFADKILAKFSRKRFETAVGEQDNNLRLALNFKEGLKSLTNTNTTENARWFAMIGDEPLRLVIQTALGFSSSIAKIDVDLQKNAFMERSAKTLGVNKFEDFHDAAVQEKTIRLFLIRSEAAQMSTSSSSIALQLLGGA